MQMDGDESSNIEDRRGDSGYFGGGGGGYGGMGGLPIPTGGGGGIFKGGLGFVAFIVIALIFGADPFALLGGGGTSSYEPAPTQTTRTAPRQQPQQPAGDAETQFVSRVLKSTEDVWTSAFRELGRQYREPKLVLYRDATRTECGVGQSAMGPFYCPADQRVYLDLAFFDDLERRFRVPGQFPQAYVIAHEIGHHVQNLLGISAKTEQMKERMSKRWPPPQRSATTACSASRRAGSCRTASPMARAPSACAGSGSGWRAAIRGSATRSARSSFEEGGQAPSWWAVPPSRAIIEMETSRRLICPQTSRL